MKVRRGLVIKKCKVLSALMLGVINWCAVMVGYLFKYVSFSGGHGLSEGVSLNVTNHHNH